MTGETLAAYYATAPFTAPANATCIVNSIMQITMSSPPAAGSGATYIGGVALLDGARLRDPASSLTIASDGLQRQPIIPLIATYSVTAGQTVQFGVYLDPPRPWAGGNLSVRVAYVCS